MKKILKCIGNTILITSISLYSNMMMGQERKNVLSKEVIKQQKLEYLNSITANKKNQGDKKVSAGSMPDGVNPFTSFHSKNKGNIHEWSQYLQKKTQSLQKNKKKPSTVIEEIENAGQNINNTVNTAQKISNFGSGENNTNRILIKGSSGIEDADINNSTSVVEVPVSPEDNGSIPFANFLTFPTPDPNSDIQIIKSSGIIGDGPHGSSGTGSGDVDVYAVILEKGQNVRMVVETSANPVISTLRPSLEVYDENGTPLKLAFPRDKPADNIVIAPLEFESPETGIYYFAITPINLSIEDIFDSSSGEIFIPGLPLDEGPYTFSIENYGILDKDHFAMNLKKGDVFGVAANNNLSLTPRISVLLPDGSLEISTTQALNFSKATETPVPRDGKSNFTYIVPQDGIYTLRIDKTIGNYETEIVAARPAYETNNKGLKQFIYLDFTGVDDFIKKDFFRRDDFDSDDPDLTKVRTLSPFRDFLENWGIENTRYNLLKMAFNTTEVVKENTLLESRLSEINPDLSLIILSDYGSETLGKKIPQIMETMGIPYSRVIIGGTIEESGIDTIIAADDIDPGNYDLENDALVLLDQLSSTTDKKKSINFIPLADGFTIEDILPVVVGNTISHAFGFYLGNFNCSASNERFTLMDKRGNGVARWAGIVPEEGEKFGDSNTRDVDFTDGEYNSIEGIQGVNRTDVNTAFALGFTPGNRSKEMQTPAEIQFLEENALKELFNEIDNLKAFSYPNPQNHQETSHLVFSSKEKGQANVTLYDLQGRKIDQLFTGKIEKGENMQLELIPSKYKLSPGVYIYNIKTPGQEINHKFSIK